jgi:23S rRNA (uracil1939-C5)-methyltransferase
LELKIDKLIYGGDGLSRLPADEHGRGKAVFVPFVLEGERVDAAIVQSKPGFARAKPNRILEPSRFRIEPTCPYFTHCGGCHYQHSTYEHQLEIKASVLRENLRRITKLELSSELKIHPSPPWNYRNRTRLRVRTHPEFAVGYYKFGSHELLLVEQCPISSPLINRAIAQVWELGRSGKLGEAIKEIEFFADADDAHLLVEIYCLGEPAIAATPWAEGLRSALPETAGVAAFPSGSTGGPSSDPPVNLTVLGADHLMYKTARAEYRVSAGSFFQTNRYLIDELVEIVTNRQSGRTAIDLYAGVGLFSVVLSREFERVIAVESSPQSHADLVYNAPVNLKAFRTPVEQFLKDRKGSLRADLVIVDPPRGGLGEPAVRGILEINAPALTYVSCDPATLARDLVPLLAAGYRVDQAHLVDLFPQTFHLETVLRLVR